MLSSLIATKLYIPPMRPDHVSRPRLVDYLDSGYRAGRRLTLVSAPAGYGKTSLMSEWQARLTGRQVPLAWLALEESDNEPLRFMHYLLAAVRKVFPRLGQELLGMLDLPQPPSPIEIAGGLINEIAALGSPLVLALDDFHQVTNPAIHEVIGFLIDRGPINLHLVIASRHDPLLPAASTACSRPGDRSAPERLAFPDGRSRDLSAQQYGVGTGREQPECSAGSH